MHLLLTADIFLMSTNIGVTKNSAIKKKKKHGVKSCNFFAVIFPIMKKM